MTENENSHCQICGKELEGQLVWCTRCKTPHHADCWSYTEVCSTYGCGSKRSVESLAAAAVFDDYPVVEKDSAPSFTDKTEEVCHAIAQILAFICKPSHYYEKFCLLITFSNTRGNASTILVLWIGSIMFWALTLSCLGPTLGTFSFLYLVLGLGVHEFSIQYIALVKERRRIRIAGQKGHHTTSLKDKKKG